MHCPLCGAEIQDTDQFCYRCGEPITPSEAAEFKPDPSATEAPSPPPQPFEDEARIFTFAGFWKRFAAWLLDIIILIAVSVILGFVIGFLGWSFFIYTPFWVFVDVYGLTISFFIGFLYFPGFESSVRQATPGKKALGIIVTDTSGKRISFVRAFVRYIGKLLSWFTLGIGHLIIAFTDKKRGLQDYFSDTLVINR